MQVLDPPAALDELRRELVEQLGMGGPGAVESEIAGGVDEPGAEVVMPYPIHHDARGERIFRRGEPSAQRHASLLFRQVARELELVAEAGESTRRDLLPPRKRIAAVESECRTRFAERAGVYGWKFDHASHLR